jgi:hypothetical protein
MDALSSKKNEPPQKDSGRRRAAGLSTLPLCEMLLIPSWYNLSDPGLGTNSRFSYLESRKATPFSSKL